MGGTVILDGLIWCYGVTGGEMGERLADLPGLPPAPPPALTYPLPSARASHAGGSNPAGKRPCLGAGASGSRQPRSSPRRTYSSRELQAMSLKDLAVQPLQSPPPLPAPCPQTLRRG